MPQGESGKGEWGGDKGKVNHSWEHQLGWRCSQLVLSMCKA